MSLIRPTLDAVDVANVAVPSRVCVLVPCNEAARERLVTESQAPANLIGRLTAAVKTDVVFVAYIRLDLSRA